MMQSKKQSTHDAFFLDAIADINEPQHDADWTKLKLPKEVKTIETVPIPEKSSVILQPRKLTYEQIKLKLQGTAEKQNQLKTHMLQQVLLKLK